jgi:Aspartyl/Asparaginyl beta-hydroxylase
MKHFHLIDRGIDTTPLVLALQRQPELWSQKDARTTFDGTSHAETADIWVRFNDPSKSDDLKKLSKEHYPIWLPPYYKLPQIRGIAYGLMARISAAHLGGVLITQIPPGGKVIPHNDKGSWHAEFFNTKVYVPLQTNDRCVNYAGEGNSTEQVAMKTGDAWFMNNLVTHSVENDGYDDRITLIVCLRVEN